MTHIITQAELETMSEAELYALYIQILNDLAKLHRSVPRCPLALASLERVRWELLRRQMRRL
jgi:hypothetical protein